ncbi:MAG: hypothetical protein Kow0029_26150 [Candidatus Rifleibacteriota bacterium]
MTTKELNQFRLLIALPVLIGLGWLLVKDKAISIEQAVPAGKASIRLLTSSEAPGKIGLNDIEVVERSPVAPDHVFINTATREELIACPGIGKKLANQILLERSYGKFVDWRDLKDRVKGVTSNLVEKLQDAGVKLNRGE